MIIELERRIFFMKAFYTRLGLGVLWIVIALANVFSGNYSTVVIYGIIGLIFLVYAAISWRNRKK